MCQKHKIILNEDRKICYVICAVNIIVNSPVYSFFIEKLPKSDAIKKLVQEIIQIDDDANKNIIRKLDKSFLDILEIKRTIKKKKEVIKLPQDTNKANVRWVLEKINTHIYDNLQQEEEKQAFHELFFFETIIANTQFCSNCGYLETKEQKDVESSVWVDVNMDQTISEMAGNLNEVALTNVNIISNFHAKTQPILLEKSCGNCQMQIQIEEHSQITNFKLPASLLLEFPMFEETEMKKEPRLDRKFVYSTEILILFPPYVKFPIKFILRAEVIYQGFSSNNASCNHVFLVTKDFEGKTWTVLDDEFYQEAEGPTLGRNQSILTSPNPGSNTNKKLTSCRATQFVLYEDILRIESFLKSIRLEPEWRSQGMSWTCCIN